MKGIQAQLEVLRRQIAECEMNRDLATDITERKLLGRLADHYKMLAAEVERVMAGLSPIDTFLGRKTQEPFPKEEDE